MKAALDGMRRLASPEAKLSIRTQGCKGDQPLRILARSRLV
jgi:hypothetical protein